MCGIFGVFGIGKPTEISDSQARHALMQLKHRGPDAQNLVKFENGFLGHARLKIIDLSDRASQPMQRGAQWITFNGEIYNYQSLRWNLKTHFVSQSDTEVLLALYQSQPDLTTFCRQLNGMAAFAILDGQKLILVRDRFGVKPLYTTRLATGEFAFASELKALLALPGCTKKLNADTLFEHFTFQHHLGSKTIVDGIDLLPAGHWATLDLNTGAWHQEVYWQPEYSTGKVSVSDLRNCFEAAVSRQLVGDVPIGSFLSGGMDTGAITAVSSRSLSNMYTFTCGFDTTGLEGLEQQFDESQVARDLAKQFHTQHEELEIDATMLPKIMSDVVWHLDDFRAGISYQNFVVSDFVSKHVTVVMSGVGGDELFAGYPWRYGPILDAGKDFPDLYYDHWVRLLSDDQKKAFFTSDFLSRLSNTNIKDAFVAEFKPYNDQPPLNQALAYDFKNFLQGLLIVEDRLSMAHSIESRVPFLDNELVDLCLQLPPNSKLHQANGELISKWILKEALKGLLPEEVLTRRKQGFTPPDATWYRGPLKPYIESILLSEECLSRGIIQPDALKKTLAEHQSGEHNHRFLIWSLMCLEIWQRHFLK